MQNDKKPAIDILVPLSGLGGVETVNNRVAGWLVKQGYCVRVVQMVFQGPFWLDAHIPFYPLRTEKVHHISDFADMYKQFLQQTYVPNIVLATPWPYMTLAAKKALVQLTSVSSKIVAWLHAPLELYKKYGVGGAECLKFADEVLVLNERTQILLSNVLPDVHVKLVHNPVDFSKCQMVTPSECRELLFVGRLSEEKCVSTILDAVAKCKAGWKLKIIGEGELRPSLVAQAEQLGITDRVSFLGWKSNPWEFAEGASALVLASEYEAFPLVAIEAMACGLPVFSTPVDGMIELIKPGENGFLYEKGNSDELAELLDLYAAKKLPQIQGEACRSSVTAYESKAALCEIEGHLKNVLDKVSVIIPCYNVEKLLPRCLESVLGQQTDGFNLEVICVDDKSTDGTLDVLMEWEKRFPEKLLVIPLEQNGRQGRARNIALQYATGHYITYVDADDAVAPGYFSRLYHSIREHNCEVAGCGYTMFMNQRSLDMPIVNEETVFELENSAADLQKYLMLCGWKTAPWGRIYRTDFLKKYEIFFAEDIFMEDVLFSNLCLKYMKRYVHIPDALYLYYYNPNGTMASEKIREYYLDTAVVMNMAVDKMLSCDKFADCIEELEYVYFSKAFTEPMSYMWNSPDFFSYEAYCYLKDNVQKRFADMMENSYLKEATDSEIRLAFSLYRANISSEEALWCAMNYEE